VSSGSASFANSGNTLTITNSANAIINWQNFSIGVNEITRFLQSSSSSAVLNRVVGANGVIPQSVIDGVLSSNGRVFLLNPNGVAIGSTGRIDVAGFVASSLNLSDADFLAGKMRFTATPGAGAVTNAGTIDTSSSGPGGQVFLVGPDVQNSGIIRTPQGQIILAAGKSVELVSENSPFVTVNITADSEQALNVGQLLADSGRIGMFGALVRQSGVAEANSAVMGANGEIRLVATKDLTLDAGSVTTANGPSGGNVTLQAQGGTNLIYGTVEAKGSSGQGGTIEALGVRVGVLGNGIIDASGDAGGGTVLVGGDQHGANPDIQNAQQTLIGPDGVIRADAATTGDGGRVIVWSDAGTQVFGSISARGGTQSGNGGFVETSSAGAMDLSSVRVDTRAPNGQWGTWLLDPLDVNIVATGGTNTITDVATFGALAGTVTNISRAVIENNFNTVGTTRIQATNNVNFRSDLTLNYGGLTPQTFEVRAVNNIDLAADGVAHTITTNGQNVALSANDVGPGAGVPTLNLASGTGAVLGNGNIVTNGGSVLVYGASVSLGSITTRAAAGSSLQGGPVLVETSTGNLVVNGNIDASGADGANGASGAAGGTVGLLRASTTVLGAVAVYGNILASGGAGSTGSNGGGAGGAGGIITVGGASTTGPGLSVYGDALVAGNIVSRGGNGASSATAGIVGGSGGGGGNVGIFATNNLRVGASTQNVVDDTGGNGGAGGPGLPLTLSPSIPAGAGGIGGGNGFVNIIGGTLPVATAGPFLIAGGQVTVNSAVIASGGGGGAGGSGSLTTPGVVGGSGGYGGFGGTIEIDSGNSVVVNGTLTATGGAAGAGGALGGAGGINGASLIVGNTPGFSGGGGYVFINAGTVTANANISVDGGKGGDGAAGGGFRGGNGGNGGTGGEIDIGPMDLAGTVTIGAGVTLSARGAAGGAGGAGDAIVNHIGGDGGAGGNGGFITLGGTFNGAQGTASINHGGTITVDGGAAGNGGAFGGNGGDNTSYGFGGSIIAYGTTITLGTLNANGGAGGAGGSGSSATATTASNFLLGAGGGGGDGGSFQVTATGNLTIGAIGASGGAGGAGGSNNTATVTGAYSALDGFDVGFAQVGAGGSGARGGDISLTAYGASVGSIVLGGGAGGAAGSGSSATNIVTGTVLSFLDAEASAGRGGNGGDGGDVSVTGTTSISIASIQMNGGTAGPAGANSSANAAGYGAALSSTISANADAGFGASGGSGGTVLLTAAYLAAPTINVGGVAAAGGASTAGGIGAVASAYGSSSLTTSFVTASSSAAAGGSGGSGGTFGANGGFISTGTLDLHATDGSAGGTGSVANAAGVTLNPTFPASLSPLIGRGGTGGTAGRFNVSGSGITVSGDILAFNGSGGTGTSGSSSSVQGGQGGGGGSFDGTIANSLTVTGTGQVTVTGNIAIGGASGGAGGAGGLYGGAGGSGSIGSIVSITAGSIAIGAINTSGGAGATGGYASTSGGYGGAGGGGGGAGTVVLSAAYGGISVGSIAAAGGSAAGGGSASGAGSYGGSGGFAGTGSSVALAAAYGITVGDIVVSGGSAGSGGSGGVVGGAGGSGGFGGTNVTVASSYGNVSVGAVLASGGVGGAGGGALLSGGYGGLGGLGGYGGGIALISPYGLAAGNIITSGGNGGGGGKGYGSLTLAGDGGSGGNAGTVTVSAYGGPIDFTAGGAIFALGGTGGKGGNGDPGNGGNGGYGGNISITTSSDINAFAPLNVNGEILQPGAITLSALSVPSGGAGGLGGTLGTTTGAAGLPGLNSSITVDGTLTIVSTSLGLDGGAVIQGTNQLALTNSAPSTDDLQKKNDENKRKNQVAACK
jgi:filamentous hemagglutinin family protein